MLRAIMNKDQIKQARQLLSLNQSEFAALLGWTTKRNIVNLEKGDKECTVQTALAIECLLRRANKMTAFNIENEIKTLLAEQKAQLIKGEWTTETIESIIFSDEDVVENYLRDNDLNEDDVDLESLRNLQHNLLNEFQ